MAKKGQVYHAEKRKMHLPADIRALKGAGNVIVAQIIKTIRNLNKSR